MTASDERTFLLRSLEDLEREREAGDLDDTDYVALKADYTARAAAALKGEEPSVRTAHRRRRPWRTVGVAVAVVAGGVLAGQLLARSAGERLPGETVSGDIRETESSEVARAQALYRDGKAAEAVRVLDEVLADDPENPAALAYRGWIVWTAGNQSGDEDIAAKGLAFVERALDADPGYAMAHWFRGLIHVESGERAAAIASIEAFLDSGPPTAMVRPAQEVLAELRAATS